jgi:hypothetical protein
MIVDLEFKRYKMQQIREDVRLDYDNLKNKRPVLVDQIAAEKLKPTMSKDEAARLDDELVILDRDVKNYEEQMSGMDTEIEGARASSENPEGIKGLNEQIESLHDLKLIVKDYSKTL